MEVPSNDLERSFIAVLVEDVRAAETHLQTAADESARRNFVRTTFAAIEGAVWICREHVREAAQMLGELTPLLDLALRERSYTVTDRGDLIEQVRHVTLTTMIRLVTKQAGRIAPGLKIDFADTGWTKLREAISIRNRITHPKTTQDLSLSMPDVKLVREAFFWVMNLTENIVSASVEAQSSFNREARRFVDALKQDDPDALRAYRDALDSDPENG